jgi:hypothetical protein
MHMTNLVRQRRPFLIALPQPHEKVLDLLVLRSLTVPPVVFILLSLRELRLCVFLRLGPLSSLGRESFLRLFELGLERLLRFNLLLYPRRV